MSQDVTRGRPYVIMTSRGPRGRPVGAGHACFMIMINFTAFANKLSRYSYFNNLIAFKSLLYWFTTYMYVDIWPRFIWDGLFEVVWTQIFGGLLIISQGAIYKIIVFVQLMKRNTDTMIQSNTCEEMYFSIINFSSLHYHIHKDI